MLDNLLHGIGNVIGGAVHGVEGLFGGNSAPPQAAPKPVQAPQQAQQVSTPQPQSTGPNLGQLSDMINQATGFSTYQDNQKKLQQPVAPVKAQPVQLKQTNPFLNTAGGALNVAKDATDVVYPLQSLAESKPVRSALVNAAQGVARDIGGAGVELQGKSQIIPQGPVQQAIFGNKPVPSLSKHGTDIAKSGVLGHGSTNIHGLPALAVGLAAPALDLAGGPEKEGEEAAVDTDKAWLDARPETGIPGKNYKGTTTKVNVGKPDESSFTTSPADDMRSDYIQSRLKLKNTATDEITGIRKQMQSQYGLGLNSTDRSLAASRHPNDPVVQDLLSRYDDAKNVSNAVDKAPKNLSPKEIVQYAAQQKTQKIAQQTARLSNQVIRSTRQVGSRFPIKYEDYVTQAKNSGAEVLSKDQFNSVVSPTRRGSAPMNTGVEPIQLPTKTQQPNTAMRMGASKATLLNQMGDAGKETVGIFNNKFNDEELTGSNWLQQAKPFMDLNKGDAEIAREAVQKPPEQELGLSPKVQAGVDSLRQLFPNVIGRANKTLSPGDLGNTYFPRMTDWSKVKPNSDVYNKALEHLVNSGQATDLSDAITKLEDYRNKDLQAVRSGNLDYSRKLDVPLPQIAAKPALEHYIRNSADRITSAEHYGNNNEVLNGQIAKMVQDKQNGQTASKIIQRVINPPEANKLGANIRGVFGLTRLSKAAISHAFQQVNVATTTSYSRDVASLAKTAFNPADRAFAKDSGVLYGIHGMEKDAGFEGIVGKGIAPGLSKVMAVNRTTAAIAGRDAAIAAAKKGDEATLRGLFEIKGDIGKTLTKDQQVQAARALVQKTMYRHNPLDTPLWAETKTGKFVGQYRMAYGYKQTGFIYNQVLKEAKNGNLAPLMRFVVGVPAAGAAVLGAKSAITGTPPNMSPANVASAGGLGLPGDVAASAPYFQSNPLQESASQVAPVAGEAVTIGQDIDAAKNGDPNALKRYALKLAPLIGNRLAAALVPGASASTIAYATAMDKAFQGASPADQKALSLYQARELTPSGQKVSPGTSGGYLNAKILIDNQRQGGQLLQRLYQANHGLKNNDPLWQLPLNAPAGKPSVTAFETVESQYEGPEKTGTKTLAQGSPTNGWITDLENARNSYYSKLPPSKDAPANEPAYPTATGQTATDLTTANNITNSIQYSQFLTAHPDVVDQLARATQWTNAIRKLEGAPTPIPATVQASPAVQATINAYNAFPPSKSAGNTDPATSGERSAWIKANPVAYNAMSNFYAQSSMTSLLKNSVEAVYSGQDGTSQSVLKEAKSAGQDVNTNSDGTLSIGTTGQPGVITDGGDASTYAASGDSSSDSSYIHLKFPDAKNLGAFKARPGQAKRVTFKFKNPGGGGGAAPVVPKQSTKPQSPKATKTTAAAVKSSGDVTKSGKNS